MAAGETAKMIAELVFKDGLTKGVNTAIGSVNRLDKGLGRVGRGAGQITAGLGKAGARIAAFGAIALGGAAKAAIDFEDAFQGVVKTVDEADLLAAGKSFDTLKESIRAMSREMPNSAIELAGIAEQAGALGIRARDIESFTKQVAILASTTNVSADDAATALGQLQNVIGLTGAEFDNFAAALVDLGNKGASTEAQILEIARRSGGAGKLIGIAKEETLGWSSAAANLGLNEELAGTALQNFYLKSLNAVQGGSKLKTMAEIAGQSAKDFKKSFDKDATGALEAFLTGLGKLPKDARLAAVQDVFGKGSGLTRLVLGLAESVDKNLTPSLDTSTKAWQDATAAQEEFDKRTQTVKSQIAILKNNLTDAAVSVGEGFAPALGRAAGKLATFLKDPKIREQLRDLGRDIGKAIDSVDWKEVLDTAKGLAGAIKPALDFMLALVNAANKLPAELKGAALGIIGLNKLSGGLIGSGVTNVAGGLAETIARSLGSKIPILGKAFVQPVFVTNMGVGGMGGGLPGAAGGIGLKTLLGGLGITALAAAAVGIVWSEVNNNSTQQSQDLQDTLNRDIDKKTPEQLLTALKGVEQGIADIQSNPLLVLVQGDALTNLQEMRNSLKAKLEAPALVSFRESERNFADPALAKQDYTNALAAAITPLSGDTRSEGIATRNALSKIQAEQADAVIAFRDGERATSSGLDDVAGKSTSAGVRAATAARQAGDTTAAAMRAAAAAIVAAVYAARPIVNSTTVNRTYYKTSQYGPSGDSGVTPRLGLYPV